MTSPLGIGIIGMGFIGQTHTRAFLAAEADGLACQLRAVCDTNPDRRAGVTIAEGNLASGVSTDRLFDPRTVTSYTEASHLLADPAVDLVCICTHTESHVDLAISALDAGKHVLVEKPVATTSAQVHRLDRHAAASALRCIPAMCVRHWPGWSDLAAIVGSGEYGKALHARFDRVGAPPTWASNFYADASRSGNAIFDLHVHDADFAIHLFGRPDQVNALGDDRHIVSQLRYQQGPAVILEGGWLNDSSVPFRMAYCVEFERAVVAFDSARNPPAIIYAGSSARSLPISPRTGFEEQARSVTRSLTGDPEAPSLATIAEALAVTRLIEAEQASAATGSPVQIHW